MSTVSTACELAGRKVTLCPKQLRVHEALREVTGLEPTDIVSCELTDEQPVLVTQHGEILAGVRHWESALRDRKEHISCIQYDCDSEQALWIILAKHQSWRGLNDFVRIAIALKLEPYLQRRALDNMRAGGRHKGLANLPKAHRIDVREEIARAAGVGFRNVSKVKEIVQNAPERLILALRVGAIAIHRAHGWCKLPKDTQLEKFTRYISRKTNSKMIRRYVLKTGPEDVASLLELIRQQAADQPGSVVVRLGNSDRTVLQLAADLLTDTRSICEIDQP
jgi:ParB-like chromosome segregation protein Spo0J